MANQTFGKYLESLRKSKAMSQRQLAIESNLTNSTISRIESDQVKPDPKTLEKIASALDEDKMILMAKFGYNDIPTDFLAIARKAEKLTEEQRKSIYDTLNNSIDEFLDDEDL